MSTERKKECKLTLKADSREFELNAFQSPRGLRDRDKRPHVVTIDCYQEFNQKQLLRFASYLQDIAFAMEINNSNQE